MNTGLLTVIAMSTFGVFKNINQSNIDPTVRKVTAMTESLLRKAWVLCLMLELCLGLLVSYIVCSRSFGLPLRDGDL